MKAHRARRDQNEPIVIETLEACGWTVYTIAQRGRPDLLCKRGRVWQPIEVKTPTGKLRPTQQWEDVPILRSAEDVIAWDRQQRSPAENPKLFQYSERDSTTYDT